MGVVTTPAAGRGRISVELVPRSPESIDADVRTIIETLPSVDTVNVPDLSRFSLRSWSACGRVRQHTCPGTARPYAAIPHLRAIDIDPDAPLPMLADLDAAGIEEVLVVTGDAPDDFSKRTFDLDAVDIIRKFAAEAPHLRVYAGLDPYRRSIIEEMDYAERKIEAGAVGFFTQPFFDVAHMQSWASMLPAALPVWWGATTVTTPGSVSYWRRRNRVVFPRSFEPTLAWHRDFARDAVAFAQDTGSHVYLMPVRQGLAEFLEGVL